MTTETEAHENYPYETHHDDPVWESGFEAGIELQVEITTNTERDQTKLSEMEAQAALWRASGACQVCGAEEDLLEIPSRHPSRPAIRLCWKDAKGLTRELPIDPEADDPPVVDRSYDNPVWKAGLVTALSMCADLFGGLPSRTPEDPEERHRNRARGIHRQGCTLCIGHAWTDGSVQTYGICLCGSCRAYVRERMKLARWTAGAHR